MSVLTRKQATNDASGLRAQAAYAARQVGPLASKTRPLAQQAAQQAQVAAQQAAQQAVPLAKTAGVSMRQGADGAVAWATPRVDAARSWAAPQIEQTAKAISESLAPMISSALVAAAHKVDAPKRKKARGRRGGKLTGILLVATAAAAAAAGAVVAMRRRNHADEFAATPPAGSSSADLGTASTTPADETVAPDPDMNGHPKIV